MGEHIDAGALFARRDLFDQFQAMAADTQVDGDILIGDFAGAAQRRRDALGARPVAHRRRHLIERPFEIDRGRPRRQQLGIGALEIVVGGIRPQRQPHAVGRGRPDQRRAAHLHRFDRADAIVQAR